MGYAEDLVHGIEMLPTSMRGHEFLLLLGRGAFHEEHLP